MADKPYDLVTLVSDESFQLWISGKASDEQNQEWSDWLNESPQNQQLFQQASALWQFARFRQSPIPEIDKEWEKQCRRLNIKLPQKASVYSVSSRKHLSRDDYYGRNLWWRFTPFAAAAVLLIGLILNNLLFQKRSFKQEYQTVSTEYGQRVQITLPEGTKIILNANSTLRYPSVWTEKTDRHFELQGEAFFDVTSHPEGPQHDFRVYTKDGLAQVKGTQFVVYERGTGTRVVVVEGGVEVLADDAGALSPEPAARILIQPGQLLLFRKGTPTLEPKTVNILPYVTWWYDQFILDETPFEEIVQRLEETYGVEIEVKDKHLLKKTLSGSIENQNLGIIVEALAKALRVQVRRNGQTVIFERPAL